MKPNRTCKMLSSLALSLCLLINLSPVRAEESGFALGGDPSGAVSEDTVDYGGPIRLASASNEEPESGSAPGGAIVEETDVLHFSGKWYQAAVEQDGTGESADTAQRFSESPAAQVYDADDRVTFIVTLRQKPLMQIFSAVEIANQTDSVQSARNQRLAALEKVSDSIGSILNDDCELGYTYTVAATGLSVTTSYGNRELIESIPEVESVYVAPVFKLSDEETGTSGLLTPSTSNATGMIGAGVVNAAGYTGKGTKIAIVDTGLTNNHPSFQELTPDKLTDASLTKEKVGKVWSSLHASVAEPKCDIENTWISTKVPFAYNYIFPNLAADHLTARSDHGTHVAGIAAANKIDSTDVVGVAPDAQIIVLQVFTDKGAEWDTILAAMEDCVVLGVDAVNMSLGSSAGFTEAGAADHMLTIMEEFKSSGIQLLAAAGNDSSSTYRNLTGTDLNLTSNPDTGLVGSPSTYEAAVSVASADNDLAEGPYITSGDRSIPITDTATRQSTRLSGKFGGKTLKLFDAGYGTAQDYIGAEKPSGDWVALVSRGNSSFTEKQAEARKAGAAACIVYNNESGVISMQISGDSIPCVSVSQKDGLFLRAEIAAGRNAIYVGTETKQFVLDHTVSSFSSWGVTPDLKLKPEITGVGGNILSSVDPRISGGGNSSNEGKLYAVMSGTSMATPQMTGATAVLYEYLATNYGLTGSARRTAALDLLMSTASPMMASDELEFSPRRQGAGLADLVAATTAGAYLSNPDAEDGRPKAEVGDSEDGEYSFTFEITNISDKDQVYTFDSSIFTEDIRKINGEQYIAGSPRALSAKVEIVSGLDTLLADFDLDGDTDTQDAYLLLLHVTGEEKFAPGSAQEKLADLNGDGEADLDDVQLLTDYCVELSDACNAVTVPAGKTVTLTASIALTEDDKAYMSNFENGIFVDGYLYAAQVPTDFEGLSGARLCMPILGFYGDWSSAPLFDDPKNPSVYDRHVYGFYHELNINPYILASGRAGGEFNAVSKENFLYEIDFGLLRSAKQIKLTVRDPETGEIISQNTMNNVSKSYFSADYNTIVPAFIYGEDVLWKGGQEKPDGTRFHYTVEGWLDDGSLDDDPDGGFTFEGRIDNGYPVIGKVDPERDVTTAEDGTRTLRLTLSDEHYIAALLFVSPQGIIMGRNEVLQSKEGETVTVDYDITGMGSEITVVAADYALNETELDLVLPESDVAPSPKKLESDRLYGSETYSQGILQYGWFSTEKESISKSTVRNETFDYTRYNAAEFINGRLIAQNVDTGDLVAVTPYSSYWAEQTLMHQGASVGKAGTWLLYDMALDYNTDRLFAVGWEYAGVDIDQDGEDDGTNYLYEFDFSGPKVQFKSRTPITGTDYKTNLLTLACSNEGVFYGVNNNSKLYRLDVSTAKCTEIGSTGFPYTANLVQSMCFDHGTDILYWGACHSDGSHSATAVTTIFYTVDPNTGESTQIGSWGTSEPAGLFVPTQEQSDLFIMGTEPVDFELDDGTALMIEGQRKRQEVNWLPWNSQAPDQVIWNSANTDVVKVDSRGTLEAVGVGLATVSATAVLGSASVTRSLTIRVVPSAGDIASYMIVDYAKGSPATEDDAECTWFTWSDLDPKQTETILKRQQIDGKNVLWLGGAYCDNKLYLAAAGVGETLIYTCDVEHEGTKVTSIGEPKLFTHVAASVGNMGVDYPDGLIIYKDLSGGLGWIDIETGASGSYGKYSPKLEGNYTSTDMCVLASGKVMVSDTIGNLYIVDPTTMATSKVGNIGVETLDYGSMFYDYNTGNVYWAPCDRFVPDPKAYVIWVDSGNSSCLIAELGSVKTNRGTEQTVMFTIPEKEPEPGYRPLESVNIDQGDHMDVLQGGSVQLTYTLTPADIAPTSVKWDVQSTGDTDVVSVTDDGFVTFLAPGTAVVTLTVVGEHEDEAPCTDYITFNVRKESRMPVYAYMLSDGAGVKNTWISMDDGKLNEAAIQSSAPNSVFYSGAYVDGYFYGYGRDGAFYKVDINDLSACELLGKWTLDSGDEVSSVAYDSVNDKLIGITLNQRMIDISLDDGSTEYWDNYIPNSNYPVKVITVDGKGNIWAAGSATSNSVANLFRMVYKGSDCYFTAVKLLASGGEYLTVFTSAGQPRPQMAYDPENDRIFLYAGQFHGSVNEMVMLTLGENELHYYTVTDVTILGKVAIQGSETGGSMTLGLLAFVPADDPDEP